MTTIILPHGYYIEVDKIRNYTLSQKSTRIDKKTGEEKEVIRSLGYYSDFGTALKLGMIKDMEANDIVPNKLSIEGYIRAIDAIETKLVEDFTKVVKVKLTEEEQEAIL